MPKGKAKKKKAAIRKPASKVLKKKTSIKKSAKKKTTKKKTAENKAAKTNKTVAKTAARKKVPAKSIPVEPGPPPQVNPPVEEPAQHEEALGTVTHYFTHLGVAIVQVNQGTVKTGDTIHILGHFTDFTQPVESMEYEHQKIDRAEAGQSIGLRVKDHVKPHDIVYRVK
jgi:GTPase